MTRVLIVDDKEENLSYLHSLLTSGDCTVDSAHDGVEALAKARQFPPDVVVSDLLMPVMDGYALLRHWKADDHLKKLPFIIYTGTYTDPEDEHLALSMGADAFILKPAAPGEFLKRVREVQTTAAVAVPVLPDEILGDEHTTLRAYNNTLVRKLEVKTLQLEESNRSLRLLGAAVDQAQESIIITEAQLDFPGPRIVSVNPAFTRITGYSAAEILGKTPRILQGPGTDKSILNRMRKDLENGEVSAGETINYRKDGTEFDVEWQIAPIRSGAGEITHYLSIQRDVTERKAKERELARTHRALELLRAGNKVLIRAENEQALRDQICRIVVETGGYRMVWVGFLQDEDSSSIHAVAHAGAEEGYLSEMKVSADEREPSGQGPAGQAIRSGQAVVCPDLLHDPTCKPWHTRAEQHGFRGVIFLPLRGEGHTFGLLGLYSAKVEPTSAGELSLLQELADNLAFGILNLRARAERQRLRSLVVKVAASVTGATGTEFFEQLSSNLAETLGAHAAFVAELLPENAAVARTLGGVVDGVAVASFEYVVAGAPCEKLTAGKVFVVERRAAAVFPQASNLETLGAQAYVGRRLDHSTGRPLGQIFVLFRDPLKHAQFVTSALQIFAARAASELERRHTDAHVREQAALLDAAHEAIFVKDLEDRITYWNKGSERIYGWTSAEALGRKTRDLLKTDQDQFKMAVESVTKTEAWNGHLDKRTKSGRGITVESRWTLVRDPQGRPKSVLVINSDITQRKRTEVEMARARETMLVELELRVSERTQALHKATREAERANRAKSEFLSRMSHELRTPLHAILGFAQLLEMDGITLEDKESVAQIVRAGTHLLGLINEVLDIACVESGKLMLTIEPVNVRGILEETLSLLKPLAAQQGVLLKPPTGLLDCHVQCSAQRFKQVILNLLSNAVKFNREAGSVAISCEEIEDRLAIKVTDTGRGVAAENIPKLFVPFERIYEVDSAIEGSGLGLSLSKHLTEAMGGRIRCESVIGEGTTFTIELPLAHGLSGNAPQSLERPLGAAGETVRSVTPRTLLYIEDNPSNLRLVERILARRPELKLLSAEEGRSGLESARQHLPDLILLDLHLPDISGEEVLRELRADPRTTQLPIVIVSADATAKQIERLRAAGADDYLTKPIDVRQFLTVVDATISRLENSQHLPIPDLI